MKFNIYFLLIVLTVVVLLFYGIRWGLGFPEYFYYDEIQYVNPAIDISQGKLSSEWLNNPPFFRFILAIQFKIVFYLANYYEWIKGYVNETHYFYCHKELFYLIARVNIILFYILLLFILYSLRKIFGWSEVSGLISVCSVAFVPIILRYGQLATNDILLSLLLLICLKFSLKGYKDGNIKDFIIASICVGLAISTKYNGGASIFTLLLAYLFSYKKHNLPLIYLIILGILIILSFAVTCPHIILDSSSLFKDINHFVKWFRSNDIVFWQENENLPMVIRILYELFNQLNFPLIIISVIGVSILIYKDKRKSLIVLISPLVIFISLLQASFFYPRFIIPLILLSVPIGIGEFVQFFYKKNGGNRLYFLIISFFIGLTTLSLQQSILMDIKLYKNDARNLAQKWVHENIPFGTKIALEPFSIPLYDSRVTCKNERPSYFIKYFWQFSEYNYDSFLEEKFSYIAISSLMYNEYFKRPQFHKKIIKFYLELEKRGNLVKIFKSPNDAYQGDLIIKLYKIE